MASVGHANTRSCRSASSGGFSAADNNATTPIAVGLADNPGVNYPDIKPVVQKSVADDVSIYGKFVNYDVGSDDVTVATGGIQSFVKTTAPVAADLGMGITGTATAGQVDTSETKGSGQVVGYNTTGNILWVDLDANGRGST